MSAPPIRALDKWSQSEVDGLPLLLGVQTLADLMGIRKQRVYNLLSEDGLRFTVYRANSAKRVSTIEVLRALTNYDVSGLEQKLTAKPMYGMAELSRLLGLSAYLVKQLFEDAGIKALPMGSHPRYATAAIAKWLGVEPDHDARTLDSSCDGEPGTSSVVKTKRGTVIEPGRPYRFSGKVYDGSDVIVIARALGVVA